jgi:sortase A
MRIVVPHQALKRVLRIAQYVLLACGVALFSYCGFTLLDTWAFQHRASRELAELAAERRPAKGGGDRTPTGAANNVVVAGALVGRIEVERLGLSAIVIEGASGAVLQRAVGHITGTALPGEPGNIGIAGHRDTFFRPLRNIRRDDVITITTPLADYRYRVVFTKIVSPQDVAVLDSNPGEVLTLVTCYPFYYVGAAPHRFIVRAVRV